MNRVEIVEFINNNPICFLSTVEENQPRVRGIRIIEANEKGILFSTGKNKDLYKQISRNSSVELCFFNQKEFKQLRLTGIVEQSHDLSLKKYIVEKAPFLKVLVEKGGYDVVVPYYLRTAGATIWSMEKSFEPKITIDF